jgi:hypothetical protein
MATAPELPPLPLRAELPPGEHSRIADAPIEDVYKEKLKILGYLTVEQVLSVAETASLRSRLNEYLGADVSVVLAEVPVQDFAPQLSLEAYTADYTFGARLREEAVTAVIPTTDLSAARHVPRFRAASLGLTPPGGPLGTGFGGPGGPIRDQAYRGTCVAHAAVAAMEHYLITHGQGNRDTLDLSEQFVYWNSKSHDGIPNDPGTFLSVAMPLLFSDGCCLEEIWPYNPNPILGNEGQGPPPPGARPNAATRRVPGVRPLTASAIAELKDELGEARYVAVSVAAFDYCWTTPATRSSGNVIMPFPGDVTRAGHAVCLVDYEDLEGEPELGGGRFILRNSWNGYWGVNSPYSTGYGTIPYAYLTTYGKEAYSIG